MLLDVGLVARHAESRTQIRPGLLYWVAKLVSGVGLLANRSLFPMRHPGVVALPQLVTRQTLVEARIERGLIAAAALGSATAR